MNDLEVLEELLKRLNAYSVAKLINKDYSTEKIINLIWKVSEIRPGFFEISSEMSDEQLIDEANRKLEELLQTQV